MEADVNLPMYAEKRITNRKQLTGLLPGKMMIKGKEKTLDCKPVDISPHGLGILTTEQLGPGTVINLKMKDVEIQFEIVWGKPDFGKRDLYRYGLVTKDHKVDLEVVFAKAGCLIEK